MPFPLEVIRATIVSTSAKHNSRGELRMTKTKVIAGDDPSEDVDGKQLPQASNANLELDFDLDRRGRHALAGGKPPPRAPREAKGS